MGSMRTELVCSFRLTDFQDVQGKRLYEVWSKLGGGHSRFRCGGRCVTGPAVVDTQLNVCAWLSLILVPSAYFALCGPGLWTLSPLLPTATAALWLLSIVLMIMTSCSDPGIIPKHSLRRAIPDMEQEVAQAFRCDLALDLAAITQEPDPLLMSELEQRGFGWCRFCRMVRPPRARHCRDCNNCVLRNDHHCPFVNNCIGQRNYGVFCALLAASTALALSAAAGSATWFLAVYRRGGIQAGLSPFASQVLLACLGIPSLVLVLAVTGLCLFHVALACCGRTTREVATGKVSGHGPTLFAPRGPSLLFARHLVQPLEYRPSVAGGTGHSLV